MENLKQFCLCNDFSIVFFLIGSEYAQSLGYISWCSFFLILNQKYLMIRIQKTERLLIYLKYCIFKY